MISLQYLPGLPEWSRYGEPEWKFASVLAAPASRVEAHRRRSEPSGHIVRKVRKTSARRKTRPRPDCDGCHWLRCASGYAMHLRPNIGEALCRGAEELAGAELLITLLLVGMIMLAWVCLAK